MEIQQIRNATLKITYGNVTFLVDPWMCDKGEIGSFADIPGQPYVIPDPVKMQIAMPIFDLPFAKSDVLSGVDYYIVTHIHPDHIDMAADGTVGAYLDKNIPVLVQNQEDAAVFEKSGFHDVQVLMKEGKTIGSVCLKQMPARHGTIIPFGDAMGIIFQAEEEPTLYVAGDTIWYPEVEKTLKTYHPSVIALNACAAETIENGRLIMGDEDVACVAKTAPDAKIVLTHLDNVAHASLTRYTLRGRLAARGVDSYIMPADGETVKFSKL